MPTPRQIQGKFQLSNNLQNQDTTTLPAVSCPWHGWTFFLHSGQCSVYEELYAETFPVIEKDDELFLEVTVKEEVDF